MISPIELDALRRKQPSYGISPTYEHQLDAVNFTAVLDTPGIDLEPIFLGVMQKIDDLRATGLTVTRPLDELDPPTIHQIPLDTMANLINNGDVVTYAVNYDSPDPTVPGGIEAILPSDLDGNNVIFSAQTVSFASLRLAFQARLNQIAIVMAPEEYHSNLASNPHHRSKRQDRVEAFRFMKNQSDRLQFVHYTATEDGLERTVDEVAQIIEYGTPPISQGKKDRERERNIITARRMLDSMFDRPKA